MRWLTNCARSLRMLWCFEHREHAGKKPAHKMCRENEWKKRVLTMNGEQQQCLIHFMFIIFHEHMTIYQSRAYSSCSTLKCFKVYIHAQRTNTAYHYTFIQCTQHNANEALFQQNIYMQWYLFPTCMHKWLVRQSKMSYIQRFGFETSAVNIIGAEQECRVPQIV